MNDSPFPPGSMVVLYARDSGGNSQDLSVSQQIDTARQFCAEHSYILTKIFKDEARPGSSVDNRHGFQEMIQHFRDPECKEVGIIIWKYSRFAREIDDSAFYKADLRRRGFTLYSINDSIPDNLDGRLFESLISWKDQRYLDDLSTDVKRGQRFIVEQYGASFGRTPTGFKREPLNLGTRRDGTVHIAHRLVPDEEKVPAIRKAFEMRASGAAHKRIRKETGLPVTINLSKLFANRIYLGELQYSDLTIPNYCDPIVSQDLWEQVQSKRKIDLHPRRAGSSFILSGLAFCLRCEGILNGHVVRSARQNTTWKYYVCSRNRYPNDCHAPRIPKLVLEQAVLLELRNYILTSETLAELQDELRSQRAELAAGAQSSRKRVNTELAKLRKKIVNLIDAIGKTGYSRNLITALSEAEYRESELIVELERLERLDSSRVALDLSPEELANKIVAALDQAEPDELKEIYGSIIARVDMEREGKTIRGTISYHSHYAFPDFCPGINHTHNIDYQYNRQTYELIRR